MKKSYITGIVVLLTISLVGILVLQGFWMRNVYESKQEDFSRDVHDALNNVVARLERQETASFIASHMVFSKEGFQYTGIKGTPFTTDSQAINLAKQNTVKQITSDESKDGYDLQASTVMDSGKDEQRISKLLKDSIMRAFGSERLTMKSNQLSQVIQQMVWELSTADVPIQQRIQFDSLDRIIREELERKDIHLQFDFAIGTGTRPATSIVKTAGFNEEDIPLSFRARLFPNDVMLHTNQLMIHFINVRPYFIRSLWWLILLSVCFTLIILGTFGSAIYVILKQKKVSEVKTDFINNMTHEFKTPIATISLAVDAIRNPKVFENKERVSYYAEIISKESKRMNTQVENILQMAMLDKENFELNPHLVDIHFMIESVIEQIRIQVEEKKGKIEFFPAAENQFVLGDEVHLTNVFYNLLENANKYSPQSPEITVSTENNEKGIIVSIQDRGIGMNAETQSKIFEQFYRAHSGNVHTVKGFGLGLAYVRSAVKKHNGFIKVSSELGKGSRFEIFIPFGLQNMNHGEESKNTTH